MTGMAQLMIFVKGFVPAVIGTLILALGLWVKGVMKQKQRNDLDEIDLSAKKIDFDTHIKPIDDLVAESNKSHGANEMVKPPRNDDENGGKS